MTGQLGYFPHNTLRVVGVPHRGYFPHITHYVLLVFHTEVISLITHYVLLVFHTDVISLITHYVLLVFHTEVISPIPHYLLHITEQLGYFLHNTLRVVCVPHRGYFPHNTLLAPHDLTARLFRSRRITCCWCSTQMTPAVGSCGRRN